MRVAAVSILKTHEATVVQISSGPGLIYIYTCPQEGTSARVQHHTTNDSNVQQLFLLLTFVTCFNFSNLVLYVFTH